MSYKNSHLLIAEHSSGRMIDIADSKNGLSCDCTCLGCGERLVAKQGQINEWHFAHESGANCTCSLESALHKAAKQIIQEEKLLFVDSYDPVLALNPNIYTFLNSTNNYLNGLNLSENQYSVTSLFYQYAAKDLVDRMLSTKANCLITKLELADVLIEVKAKNSNLIPDITCIFDGKPLYIEILVTHECDENKINELKKLKIPTIEIDLSGLRHINFKMNDIREALVNSGIPLGNSSINIKRKWIIKPKYIAEAEFYAKQFIEVSIKKIDEIALERAEKQAEIAARKTKIKAFGTTIVVNKFDFGVSVWIPQIDGEIFNELNFILLDLKAKRRKTDWLLTTPDAKDILILEINLRYKEKLNQISELAIEKVKQKKIDDLKNEEMKAMALKKVDTENANRRELAAQQKILDQAAYKIDLKKAEDEEITRAAENRNKEAKRLEFIKELTAKHSNIYDYRWKAKKINDDLIEAGFDKL